MGIGHNGLKKWKLENGTMEPCVGIMGGSGEPWYAWSRCSRSDFEGFFLRVTRHLQHKDWWCMPGELAKLLFVSPMKLLLEIF